jgi:hypothetical protein
VGKAPPRTRVQRLTVGYLNYGQREWGTELSKECSPAASQEPENEFTLFADMAVLGCASGCCLERSSARGLAHMVTNTGQRARWPEAAMSGAALDVAFVTLGVLVLWLFVLP